MRIRHWLATVFIESRVGSTVNGVSPPLLELPAVLLGRSAVLTELLAALAGLVVFAYILALLLYRHGIGTTSEEDHVYSTAPKSSLLLAVSSADIEDEPSHDDQGNDTLSEESIERTPPQAETGSTAAAGIATDTATGEPDRTETELDEDSPEAEATDPVWELER